MSENRRDSALSEVIGMILIIAIVVAVMSMYVLYMVPEKGKAGEIRHMNDVRGSFLELSYLIDSLWTNGQTDVPVAVPIKLRSSSEPSAIPLFIPIASQARLAFGNTANSTLEITFGDFSEQRASKYPDEVLNYSSPQIRLNETPYRMILEFEPTASPGGSVELREPVSNGWRILLEMRRVVTDVDFASGTQIVNQSVVAVALDRTSGNRGLEYVVISDLKGPIPVDIKPVLDLFPEVTLVANSYLYFVPQPWCPELTISYGQNPTAAPPIPQVFANSALTDLTFASHNYYWVDQQFWYHKGGVFLRQDHVAGTNSTSLSNVPLRIRDDVASITDIEIRPARQLTGFGGSPLPEGAGTAQVIATVSEINTFVCDIWGDCKYNAADATAKSVHFLVKSNDPDTLQMWERNVFGQMCRECSSFCCVIPNSGQVVLDVWEPAGLQIQYAKVLVDMEIRP